jgi:hypothetical protein
MKRKWFSVFGFFLADLFAVVASSLDTLLQPPILSSWEQSLENMVPMEGVEPTRL